MHSSRQFGDTPHGVAVRHVESERWLSLPDLAEHEHRPQYHPPIEQIYQTLLRGIPTEERKLPGSSSNTGFEQFNRRCSRFSGLRAAAKTPNLDLTLTDRTAISPSQRVRFQRGDGKAPQAKPQRGGHVYRTRERNDNSAPIIFRGAPRKIIGT